MDQIVGQLFNLGMASLVTLVVQVIKGVWPVKFGELSDAGTVLIAFIVSEVIIGGQEITTGWPLTLPQWYSALVIDPIVGTLIAIGVFQTGIKAAIKLNKLAAQRNALRRAKAQTPPE